MNSEIETIYRNRVNVFTSQLVFVEKRINWISNLRLAVVISAIGLMYLFVKNGHQLYAGVSACSGVIVFIFLYIYHDNLFKKKQKLSNLIAINKNGIKRVTNKWNDFKETGAEFINDEHPYTSDLDIFGESSLYQWINATNTFYGKHFLSSVLCGKNVCTENINFNQEAIKELSSLIDIRQNIQEAGMIHSCADDPSDLIVWSEYNDNQIISRKFELFFIALPYISLMVIFVDILFLKTIFLPSIMYFLQLVLFGIYYSKLSNTFNAFENKSRKLNIFATILTHIENQQFSSTLLKKLHSLLASSNGDSASKSIARFSQILAKAELRFNALPHFIMNAIWLWDIKCALKADKWKAIHGKHICSWLETIGHIEKLSSLSIISFEHPSWSFPTVNISEPIICSQNIQHPLIPSKNNIGNDFIFNKDMSTCIITGSNMSGKSTFLRTIATNLVLAYAGAPVCADKMHCSTFKIYTSMRTKDNLKSNVSTFFSELLRIKKILNSVNTTTKTFFLIDEMFSGTNSKDRVTGAIAVLRALQSNNAIGLISTHDLELCDLEIKYPGKFINYHFREYYDNNNIRFDYKMYRGPSETRNAIHLIRMVGIPISE